jgi:hypothetical protein
LPDSYLDYSIAGVRREAIGGASRTAAETPGSARLLDGEFGSARFLDGEFIVLDAAAASSPPAAASDGAAHRAIS